MRIPSVTIPENSGLKIKNYIFSGAAAVALDAYNCESKLLKVLCELDPLLTNDVPL